MGAIVGQCEALVGDVIVMKKSHLFFFFVGSYETFVKISLLKKGKKQLRGGSGFEKKCFPWQGGVKRRRVCTVLVHTCDVFNVVVNVRFK